MRNGKSVPEKNLHAFFLSTLMYTIAVSFLADGYVQAYLLSIGLDLKAIGRYGTTASFAAISGYLLYTRVRISETRTSIRLMLICAWIMCVFPPALILANFSLHPMIPICLCAVIYQLAASMKAACENCSAPLLFPRSEYGPVTARSGMLGSLAAALISLASSLLAFMDTKSKYMGFFAFALLGFLLSALLILRYRPCNELSAKAGQQNASGKAVRPKLPRVLWLLLPHFLRGCANGVLFYFVPIAFANVQLDAFGQSIFVTLGVAGTMGGCWLFMIGQKRRHTGQLIFVSNLIVSILLVTVCFVKTPLAFYIVYTLYMIANTITGYAVPTGMINTVEIGELQWITPIRLFVLNASNCVLITPIASLLTLVPALPVAAAGAAVYIADGFVFRRQLTDALKDAESGKEKEAEASRTI